MLAAAGAATAQEEGAVYEQEPYDLVRLTEEAGGNELKVLPLELPGRRVPSNPPAEAKLRLRLFSRPDRQYEVAWKNVAEVLLFEQFALEKAAELVAEKKFTEAYGYYQFLNANYPDAPGLDAAVEKYLLANAQATYIAGKYDVALAMLLELKQRSPERAGVVTALARVVDKLIETRVRARQFDSARDALELLGRHVATPTDPTLVRWRTLFETRARQGVEQARSHLQAGRYSAAREAIGLALAIWPEIEGGSEVSAELEKAWPQVVVGVTSLAGERPSGRLDDWAGRRLRRLTARPLVELVGYGAEGGTYRSPVGELELEPDGAGLTLRMRPGIVWSRGGPPLTGYDISRLLLAAADPAAASYRADLARQLEAVSVRDVYRVELELREAHPRLAALLDIPLAPTGGETASFGPYAVAARSAEEIRLTVNAEHAAPTPRQPREIVERLLTDSDAAVEALRAGRVDILDRVAPWDVARLEGLPGIVVEPYAFPTVHVLIPNRRRPAMANRALRRAIVYGIQRRGLLDQELLAGRNEEGNAVVSGPFPVRTALDDPLGYASDESIAPRPYAPRLALTLATLARREPGKAEEPEAFPPLVLAHPPDPLASLACDAIREHLARVGIVVRLRPRPATSTDDDYDLLYAALAMWEPVVDAQRLLGEEGLTGGASPYMALALRQLAQTQDSRAMRLKLHEIHRLAHDDVAVIPLWQLVEHCAYRARLSGVGERPTVIYERVETWQTDPRGAAP